MKLSEAINLGSTLRKQTYGAYVDDDGTCAMGAALESVGQLAKKNETNNKRIEKIWPWLKWAFMRQRCPACGRWKHFPTVRSLIIHMNDEDHISRQQIAVLISHIEVRAERQIADLVPSFRDLRLSELEANLNKKTKKKKSVREETVEVPR